MIWYILLGILFILINAAVTYLCTVIACQVAASILRPTRIQDLLEDGEVGVIFKQNTVNSLQVRLHLSHHMSNLPTEELVLYDSYTTAHDIVENIANNYYESDTDF